MFAASVHGLQMNHALHCYLLRCFSSRASLSSQSHSRILCVRFSRMWWDMLICCMCQRTTVVRSAVVSKPMSGLGGASGLNVNTRRCLFDVSPTAYKAKKMVYQYHTTLHYTTLHMNSRVRKE